MLSQLYIENIAVIRQATIELDHGLNVFTGETGAGKTILISAINAVLGARTSRDIIRSGETKALVSALFTEVSAAVAQKIASLGYSIQDGQLMILRKLDAGGSGSCKINGRPATTALLRETASLLIDIHGQHDNQDLLSPEKHLGFIDSFGNVEGDLRAYGEVYRELCRVRERLSAVQVDETYKLQRMDILQYQVGEIEAARLSPGEEEELRAQKEIIKNSEKITNALGTMHQLLSGGEDADGLIGGMEALGEELSTASRYIADLEEYKNKALDLRYDLEELSSTVRGYLDDYNFDPRQLDQIEDRLDLLYKLKKKYGATVEDILDYGEKAAKELEELTFSDELAEKLHKEEAALTKKAQGLADVLTKKRQEQGDRFIGLIQEELAYLDMPEVRFVLVNTPKALGPSGCDGIEFFISTNPGEAPKPLSKIASGGELARIMLAMKNVLADRDGVDTMIFDEIDTGVSGRAAQKIGLKLAQVAQNRQVVCVTHLAQVAAYGNHHSKIFKTVTDQRTYTQVEVLDREERVAELARITVGENITDLALNGAREMLTLAGN